MLKKLMLFPFIFAIYPVLFLYSYNAKELLIRDIILPSAVTLIVSIILFLILYIIMKDRYKSSFITALWCLILFTYGILFQFLSKGIFIGLEHRYFMSIIIFLALYASYFIYKVKSSSTKETIAKLFNIMALTLLAMNIVSIIPTEMHKLSINKAVNQNISLKDTIKSKYPDIYYIVLDEYASLDTIKEIWGYDNSEFKNELEKQGFYVANKSSVRYADTLYSTASTMNMEYVNNKEDIVNLFDKINNNLVMKYLDSKGYYNIAFDNIYSLVYKAKGKVNADVCYDFTENLKQVGIDNNFVKLVIESSIIKPYYDYIYIDNISKERLSTMYTNKLATIYTFNGIRDTVEIDGPKFVYAHILCPHPPFFFDQNGEDVNPSNILNWDDKRYYKDQYIYITNKVKESISYILENSKKSPIIVVQSDHGPRGNLEKTNNNKFTVPNVDKKRIFNAYYLPGIEKEKLYDDISPVNTFRLIFNEYFSENYEFLEDK